MLPLSVSLGAPSFGLTLYYLANDAQKKVMLETAKKGSRIGAEIGRYLVPTLMLYSIGHRVVTQEFEKLVPDLVLSTGAFFESALIGFSSGLTWGWWNSI